MTPEKCTHEYDNGLMLNDIATGQSFLRCVKCKTEWNDWKEYINEIRQQSELKGFNEGIDKIEKLLEPIKNSEDDGLYTLPEEVSMRVQTGWLLGYADCWNKFKIALQNLKTRNGSG